MDYFKSTKIKLIHPLPINKGHSPGRRLPLSPLFFLFITKFRGIVFGLIIMLLLLFQPFITSAQDFSRTITKSAAFTDKSDPGNKFRIMNINGSVTIEAYDGDTIELIVTERIQGTSSEIEQARQELEYKLEKRENLILAYLDAPFVRLKYRNGEVYYNIDREEDEYQFVHDVEVKVPHGILLEGSTINKGKLTINGEFKEVEARNVNGGLDLQNMTSKTSASTVNGDITITYDQAPDADSEYHTVNGTIEINMPADLSADVYFESMHGDLYTDFENIQRIKPQVQKATRSNHSSTTYQVDKFSPLRIGSGGPKLQFQVLNGDVYLRKK